MIQAALFIGALATLLLGIFVLLNNPRSVLLRFYFIFSASSTAWVVANAFTTGGFIQPQDGTLLMVSRLITPFSLVASLNFLYFLEFFITNKLRRLNFLIAVPSIAVGLFSFTDLNVYLNTSNQPTLGGLYPFYVLVIIMNVLSIFYILYGPATKKIKSYKKLQMAYLKIGTLGALVPAVGLGAVLPIFTKSPLINLSPLFSLVFLVFAGVAIVRHRLFDVRLAVTRSLAYACSIAVIFLGYMAVAFALSNYVFEIKLGLGKELIFGLLSVIAAVSYQPIKKLFDHLTSKFFYQDAYNPQIFFAALNRTLVSTIELDKLLLKVTQVIESNFKTDSCLVVLRGPKEDRPRIVGSGAASMLTDMSGVHSGRLLAKTYDPVVITDYLEAEDDELKRILVKNNIAVLARLGESSSRGSAKKELGHIIIGPKKSGNPYNTQDMRVIETVTNELVIAIQNAMHFEEIQNFNLTLQQRVEDATSRLRGSNRKLKLLDETKDDFISMASHQLRTPLTSVKGYISLVLDGDAGPVKQSQRKLLTQAFISSQRMVYLISDLLNVSRLRTGKFIIETSPVNLSDIVEEEVRQLVETAEGRGLTLTYHKPTHFPVLELDETKTRQVAMNFIDNAIYYTPAGGHIEVMLLETPKTIEFRVVDDGIGVPKAEQHHLFSKFYRAKNAQKARPDGTGLGLFMAKKVVIAQGGALIFSSQEGHGSTFGFSFAKEQATKKPQT